jgi:hypothetical protein
VAAVAATGRGAFAAVAFVASLLGRGVRGLALGAVATVAGLARGMFAVVRGLVLALVWTALLPFRGARLVLVAAARGALGVGRAAGASGRAVGQGIASVVRDVAALVGAVARVIGAGARAIGTRRPEWASVLPLATLLALAIGEIATGMGFPFATLGLLVLAGFTSLALLPHPTHVLAVLAAFVVALAAGWRAEHLPESTGLWFDALVYLCSLAAIRSAYVAARSFAREAAVPGRAAEQERAHLRASRAIGAVLAVQCIAFALWNVDGGFATAQLLGELLLVGGGLLLAWVVRRGKYVGTAQVVLSLGAFASVVALIAAQLSAWASGQFLTATSIGAGVLVLALTAALCVVVHARMTDSDFGA